MSPLTTRVRELRKARGWSQAQLALEAGVRQAGISHLENLDDAQKVDLTVLERVAKAFGMPTLSLLEEAPKPAKRRRS